MKTNNGGLDWLFFDGGPMVLLPLESIADWQGAGDPSPSSPSDYDRACAIQDALGAIVVGTGAGLVVSVEGHQTAWVPSSDDGGMLVEWVYASDSASAAHTIAEVPDAAWSAVNAALDFPSGRARLFWAATSGHDSDGDSPSERIELTLRPGRYAVTTTQLRPDDETCLLAHRLKRVGAVGER